MFNLSNELIAIFSFVYLTSFFIGMAYSEKLGEANGQSRLFAGVYVLAATPVINTLFAAYCAMKVIFR